MSTNLALSEDLQSALLKTRRFKSDNIDVEALREPLAPTELLADQPTERTDEARTAADRAEAKAPAVKAQLSGDAALIAHLRLEIASLTPAVKPEIFNKRKRKRAGWPVAFARKR